MTTFSQFVDEMVQETKRLDLLTEIQTYVNQTVREVHFRSDSGSVLYYKDNFAELQLTADVDTGFVWDIPSPATFQGLIGVQFMDQFDRSTNRHGVWAKEVTPGRNMQLTDYYFYRVGSRVVFSDYGKTGSRINLAMYLYPPRLKYYTAANRPATYDDVGGWTYLPAYDTTDEQRELARNLSSNWLLLRWHDVLAEGVRAKIYKRVSDDVRGRTAYSLFMSLRQGLWTSEVADLGGPV